MRIHQRTEEEQRRIAEKGRKILSENPNVMVKELAKRFEMKDSQLIALMKKYGYQAGRRKKNDN